MNLSINLTTTLLILIFLTSYRGFKDVTFFNAYCFSISGLKSGQWYRVITSGFLHVGWWHLLVNAFTFYFFAPLILAILETHLFIGLYLFSLIAGNLLTYFYYNGENSYTAVGASGAISGIVFSSLIFDPSLKLFLLPIPFPIPAPLFGLGFIVYSIIGIIRNADRIGHSAHIGGGLGGMIYTLFFYPYLLQENAILWIFLPLIIIALYLIKKWR